MKYHDHYEGNHLRAHGNGDEEYYETFYIGVHNVYVCIIMIIIRIMEI